MAKVKNKKATHAAQPRIEGSGVLIWAALKSHEEVSAIKMSALTDRIRSDVLQQLLGSGIPGSWRIYSELLHNNGDIEIPEKRDDVLLHRLNDYLADKDDAGIISEISSEETEFILFALNRLEGVTEAILMDKSEKHEIWFVFDESRSNRPDLYEQCSIYFAERNAKRLRYSFFREENINRELLFPLARFLPRGCNIG